MDFKHILLCIHILLILDTFFKMLDFKYQQNQGKSLSHRNGIKGNALTCFIYSAISD